MRYLVVKPYKPYMLCYSFDNAKKVCDEFNNKWEHKCFILELDEANLDYYLKQKTYNLKTANVVYDPFSCAPTIEEKNFYDNTIFTKPLKPQKGVRI